jgi:hypothetical protein
MKRTLLLLVCVLSTACGSPTTFESIASSQNDSAIDENGPGPGSGPGPTSPDENLPGETSVEEQIPVKQIVDDPTLLDNYPCPTDPTSVLICHFPEGSTASNTQCIGRSAVYSHVDHFQEATGEFDYLGACRP